MQHRGPVDALTCTRRSTVEPVTVEPVTFDMTRLATDCPGVNTCVATCASAPAGVTRRYAAFVGPVTSALATTAVAVPGTPAVPDRRTVCVVLPMVPP